MKDSYSNAATQFVSVFACKTEVLLEPLETPGLMTRHKHNPAETKNRSTS